MPAVVGKPAVRDDALPHVVVVAVPVRAHAPRAVVLLPAGAPFAVGAPAGVALGADADAVAEGDAGAGVRADAGGCADDFVADAAGVDGLALGSWRCIC